MLLLLCIWSCCTTDVTGWLCGNDGQCICDSDRSVACYDAVRCPVFPVKARYGRVLLLHVADENFDLTSLDWSYGFEIVKLFGASYGQCRFVNSAFHWIDCMPTASSQLPPVKTTKSKVVHSTSMHKMSTVTENDEHDDHESQVFRPPNWLIIALAVGGAIVGIMIICMLVSLVNLHQRLNLRTRADDDASYAILCCMACMGLCLAPFHLCGKLCNCNWRGVRDLDQEMRIL